MKMRNWTRIVALLLSLVMLLGMFAGCGNEQQEPPSGNEGAVNAPEAEAGDTSEFVELKMYLIGDPTQDFDMMWEKANEYLKETLNCTVDVEWLSWSEHDQKYSLLFSGNEDFDLIFTAVGWGHYDQVQPLGGFYPLDEEFIAANAPALLEHIPEAAWEQAKVGGIPYMVPANFAEFSQDVVVYRGDLMEKYGITEITCLDDVFALYEATAADGMYATSYMDEAHGLAYLEKGYWTINGTPSEGYYIWYHIDDASDLGYSYYIETEEYAEFCHKMKKLADAGAWSPDILNSTAERQDGLLNGTAASFIWNSITGIIYADQANAAHPEWKVSMFDPMPSVKKGVKLYTNAGMAINANSDNPERAMQVIEALNTDTYLHELTRLGIEGYHWEAVGDNEYTLLTDTLGVDVYCTWGWRNDGIMRKQYVPEDEQTLAYKQKTAIDEAWANNKKTGHPLDGFVFDPTNVATQVAAVESLYNVYYMPLGAGLVDDVDATIAEFRDAMRQAGIQDILDELQVQIDAYLASK